MLFSRIVLLVFMSLIFATTASARYLQPDPVSVHDKVLRKQTQAFSSPLIGIPGQDAAAIYGIAALANVHIPQPPLEINPYAYTVNNPLRWQDPDGQNTVAVGGGIGFLVGGPPGAVVGALIGGAAGVGIYYLCKNAVDDPKEKRCQDLLDTDTSTCNGITRTRGAAAGAKCHASASQRYAACLRGQPIPPLDTWNN